MVVRNGKIFFSLHEIAPQSPYSADYLRIRILQKKLRGIKIGREWYTTKEWIEGYLNRYAIRSIQEQFARAAEETAAGAPAAQSAPIQAAPAAAVERQAVPTSGSGVAAPVAVPGESATRAAPPSRSLWELLRAVPKKFAAVPAVALLAFVLVYPAAREVLNRAGAFFIERPVPDIAALPDELFLALGQAHESGRNIFRPVPDAVLRVHSAIRATPSEVAAAGRIFRALIASGVSRAGEVALELKIPELEISDVSISASARALADYVGEFSPADSIRQVGEQARIAAQAVLVGLPQGTGNAAVAISDRVGRLAIETEIPRPGKVAGGAIAVLNGWGGAFERTGERIARGLDGAIGVSRVGIAAVGGGIAKAGSGITALERVIDERTPQAVGSALSGMIRSVAVIERGIQENGGAVAGLLFSEIAQSAKEALFQFPGRLAELIGLKQPSQPPSRLTWQEVEVVPMVAEAPPAGVLPRAGESAPDREVTRVREVVETREVIRTADLTELDRRLNEINAGLRGQVNKLVGDVAALYEGPEAKVSIVRTFAPSQSVDRLSNITFSGSNSFNLTDADIPNDISVSGYLGLGGGTITGTTTFSGITLTSGSAGFGTSTPSNFFSVAGDAYLTGGLGVGTATNSPGGLQTTGAAVIGSNLTVRGTATSTFSGPLEVTGIFTAGANTLTISSTSTLTNQLTLTRSPTTAHTFASWSVGVANSAVTDASLVINPASAASDTNLFGVALNDGARFLIDAEGDIFANSVTLAGGATLATTTISGNVTIEGNATLGDAPNADTHAIRGATTIYATTTNAALAIWNSTRAGDLLRLRTGDTSPTTEFVFTAAGQAAFGTTTPSGLSVLTLGATTTNSIPLTLKGVTGQTSELFRILDSADAQLLTVSSAGRLGIGTSTPWGLLSVEHAVSNDSIFPAFVVADTGTATPSFIVLNRNGNVGVATRTPEAAFAVGGVTLTGSAGATSTNIGAEDIKQHLRTGSLEILGACKGCGGSAFGNDGEIQFNTSGAFNASNRLFWDNTNFRLGIATGTPGTALSVTGSGAFTGSLMAQVFKATSTAEASIFPIASTTSFSIANLLTVSGAGTSTFSGGADITNHFRAGSIESTGDLKAVAGNFSGRLTAVNASTTGSASIANLLTVSGAGTSTFSGGLTTGLSLGVGTTAPSGFYAAGISGPLLYGGSGATSTNIGGEDIKAHLRVGSLEIVGACAGCPAGGGTPGGSDGQVQYNNSTAFGGAPNFVFDDATNRVGIGTTTPGLTFSVGGPTYFDTSFIQFGSSTASSLTLNFLKSATSTIPNNQPYSWTIATSTTNDPIIRIDTRSPARKATTTITGGFQVEAGAISHDWSSGITSFDSIQTGPMAFDTDAGIISWVDMPSATTTAGIALSYSAQIDSTSLLTIYSTTSASGLISTGFVGIASSTPSAALAVRGSGDTVNTFLTYMEDQKGNARFVIRDSGLVGIGTTTPGALLSVSNGSADIGGVLTVENNLKTGYLTATSSTASFFNFASSTSLSLSNLLNVSGAGTSTFTGGLTIATGGGTVGIGSSTPALKLSVAGMVNLNLVDGGSAAVCHTNALTATEGVTLGDCTGAPAQDYAELYSTSGDVEFGDIVVAAPDHSTETRPTAEIASSTIAVLAKSSRPYEAAVIGVASNNYGDFTSTGHGTIMESDHPLPVALIGRVPVKVSTEGGPIKAGDRITTSSLPGVGMKATTSGPTIGVALESFPNEPESSSNEGKVLVFINLGYARLDGGTRDLALGTSDAWSVDPDTGRISTVYGVDLNGNDLLNVRAVFSANGAWSIDESGKLVAREIETEKLSVKEETRVGSADRPRGITLFDFDTGQPNCVFVQSGAVRSVPGECTFTGQAEQPATGNQPPATNEPAPPPPVNSEPAPSEPAVELAPEPEPAPESPPAGDDQTVTESAPEPPESAPQPEDAPPPEPPPPPSEPVAEPPPSESAPAAGTTL